MRSLDVNKGDYTESTYMKKVLSINKIMKYLGISEKYARRIINKYKVKIIRIVNKNLIARISLAKLYDPRPFNPEYIILYVNDAEIKVTVNTGWVPFDDYLYVHDILLNTSEFSRVYDEKTLSLVYMELMKIFSNDYRGIYIERWRYRSNEDFYNLKGFKYSEVEDWYICDWENIGSVI